MPELPEVQTIVSQLKTKVLKRTFVDCWTDTPKLLKGISFDIFKKKISKKRIKNIWRRGKNILFELSDGLFMLIHQKMTGHLMLGKWEKKNGFWIPKTDGPFAKDKANKYIRFIFFLDNGQMLAFSDLRKFGKIRLGDSADFSELAKMGPEPLDQNFKFSDFLKAISKKKNGKIKQVLMDQDIIAGIGNIYSDEILWRAKVQPFKKISGLNDKEKKDIFKFIKSVLKDAVDLKGESFSDYRDLFGEKGNFDKIRKVYKRQGELCSKCKTEIIKKKIGSRSTCFCPNCQK